MARLSTGRNLVLFNRPLPPILILILQIGQESRRISKESVTRELYKSFFRFSVFMNDTRNPDCKYLQETPKNPFFKWEYCLI